MMSLVDYASSSDDDVSEDDREKPQTKPPIQKQQPISSSTSPNNNQKSISSTSSSSFTNPSNPVGSKLPDASLLLNSPSISSSAINKRPSSQMAPSNLPRSKLQKGNLLQTKSVPDTDRGLLIPPQLSGKSNIVTEDIGKLFVKRKNAEVEP